MTEKIVINTGPLLAFGKMQALETIGKLPFEIICPAEVAAEIRAGAEQGYAVEIPDWLTISPLAAALSPLSIAALDTGEAAVIQLALEQKVKTVCIDELKGRRAASSVGLNIVGSLGMIGKAKTLGLIAAVKPFIAKAQNGGIFYDDKLIAAFLKSFGE